MLNIKNVEQAQAIMRERGVDEIRKLLAAGEAVMRSDDFAAKIAQHLQASSGIRTTIKDVRATAIRAKPFIMEVLREKAPAQETQS